MELKVKRGKLAIILEIILFLMFMLISILLFSKINEDYNISKTGEENLYYSHESYDDILAQNDLYIKKIRKDYGINIYYGENIESIVSMVNGTAQYDEVIVNNNLKIIYEALKKYPDDVFDMSRSKKYPINIILLNKFSNDNLALASRNSLNEFRIYISNTAKFERAFHHEMYHILEYYMSDTRKNLFSTWKNLNPANFKYVSDISDLTYEYVYVSLEENMMIYDKNPYFVTKYSKTSEKEDRAEIFAELMILNTKVSYLQEGQNIKKKALLLTDTINENVTVNNFYYTKYLK